MKIEVNAKRVEKLLKKIKVEKNDEVEKVCEEIFVKFLTLIKDSTLVLNIPFIDKVIEEAKVLMVKEGKDPNEVSEIFNKYVEDVLNNVFMALTSSMFTSNVGAVVNVLDKITKESQKCFITSLMYVVMKEISKDYMEGEYHGTYKPEYN